MLRFKQFLFITEDTDRAIDFLKGKYSDRHSDIDKYAENADPTKEKMYVPRLLAWQKAGLIGHSQSDHENLREILTNFHKLKDIQGRLPKRDIGAYKTPSELEDAVVNYAGESGKQKDERAKKDIELIHNENGVSIISPKTEDATKLCSKNARWCTGAEKDNMFNYYTKASSTAGPLYIMHIPQKDEKGKLKLGADNKPLPPTRYQYHPSSGEFRDEQDKNADLNDVAAKNPEIVNGLRKIGLGKDLVANREELEEKLKNGYDHEKARLLENHPLVTPEDITKTLNDHAVPTSVKMAAVKHPTAFTKEHMDELIDDPNKYGEHVFHSALENSPALKEEHVDKIVNEFSAWKKVEAGGEDERPSNIKKYTNAATLYALFNTHGGVKSHHISTILNNTTPGGYGSDNDFRRYAVANPAATSGHIDQILNNRHESEDVRGEALRSPSLTPKQVTKVMLGNPDLPSNRQEFVEKTTAIMHPTAVRSGHIDMMLNDKQFKHWSGTEDVLEQSNAVTPKHIDKIINDPSSSYFHVTAALNNKTATPENVDTLLNNYFSSGGTHRSSVEELFSGMGSGRGPSPLIRPHHIDALLDEETTAGKTAGGNHSLIYDALDHPTALEPHHIDKILANPALRDSFIHKTINSPAFTSEHIGKILKDPELVKYRKSVIADTIIHPKLLPSHVDRVLNDDNFSIEDQKGAIQHPTAVRPRHIDDVLDNPDKYGLSSYRHNSNGFANQALQHPTAVRSRHIDKILDNSNKYTPSEIKTALNHPTAVTPEHNERILNTKPKYGASLDDIRKGKYLNFDWSGRGDEI
jgi:hypothetical protein